MSRELKPWEPEKLSSRHHQVLALLATGLRNQEVAEIVGMSESRISIIKNHPDGEKTLARLTSDHVTALTQDVGEAIGATSKEAFLKIRHLMRHAEDQKEQRICAQDILDRGGFKAREVSVQAVYNIDAQAGQSISEALREARADVEEYEPIDDTGEIFGPSEG